MGPYWILVFLLSFLSVQVLGDTRAELLGNTSARLLRSIGIEYGSIHSRTDDILFYYAEKNNGLAINSYCKKSKESKESIDDALIEISKKVGRTPLLHAISRGSENAAIWLLICDKNGLSLIPRYPHFEHPFVAAAGKGMTVTMLAMVNRGVGVNVRDVNGNTALHRAAWAGEVETIKWLLEKGAKVNVKNKDGHKAAFLALAKDQDKIINSFIENEFINYDEARNLFSEARKHRAVKVVAALLREWPSMNQRQPKAKNEFVILDDDGPQEPSGFWRRALRVGR